MASSDALRDQVAQALFAQGTPIHAFDCYEATVRYREAQADTAIGVVLGVIADEIKARPFRCPVHGMTDCSPLLNGCSIPNQAATWALAVIERLRR